MSKTLTVFGKEIRKLRIDKDMTLKSLADKAGVTSSYLSSIETGRKSLSSEFALKLAGALSLNEKQTNGLMNAASQTVSEVRIRAKNDETRMLAMSFARKIEDGSINIEQLKKLLNE